MLPVTEAPAAPAAPAAPGSVERAPRPSSGIFDADENVDFAATIAALRRGDQQRMVFRLDNGQIWMQNAPRDLPFSEGDRVTVKSARLGGYIMRSAGGTSTRVRRIE